jgi:predicted PurR-regulated permease PerM
MAHAMNKEPAADSEAEIVAFPRIVTFAAVGSFVILLAGAVYIAHGFFLPILLAVLVTLTFRPLVRTLSRRGVPAAATAILLVLLLGTAVFAVAVVLAGPFAQMVADAPTVIAELKERFKVLSGPITLLADAGRQVQELAASPDGELAQRVVIAPPSLLSWAAATLTGIGTTLGATLILAVFLLSTGDLFLLKLVRVVGSLSEAKRSLRIVHDIENVVSRYLLTITVINIGFGCAVGTAMALLGLANPLLWAAAATVLNFIPYLGALIGIGTALAIGLITFPTLAMAALPPVAYLVIHLTESTFVTPLVVGRRLELNAVAILVALAFCGWMWGIVGAVIGVPLLVVVKVFADNFPSLAAFGEFLSGEVSGPEPEPNGNGEPAEAIPASAARAASVSSTVPLPPFAPEA